MLIKIVTQTNQNQTKTNQFKKKTIQIRKMNSLKKKKKKN